MHATGFSVRGRQVVVVGAARSGIAAAALAARKGARVTLTESRSGFEGAETLRSAGVALELGGHQPGTLAHADLIVVSPGVRLDQPVFDAARARDVEIVGELEFAWRWIDGRVIAITGSKGKSTTTTLIGRMLDAEGKASGRKVMVGGNIGTPLSAQVEQSDADTIHVVEASSFQLETTTTFRPWIAVWLNFSDDHLDRHPTMDAYASAKARIFANQTADDWTVLNADDARVMREGESTAARRVLFSLAGSIEGSLADSLARSMPDGFVVDGEWIVRRTGTLVEPLIPLGAVELTGRHMLNNVLAAAAATHLAGATPKAMVAALRGFHGLPHVMEPAGQIDGVRFVNDSKATNVEAARRSIESFDHGVVAIVGGRFKGGNLRDLREALTARGRAAIAIGESAPMVRDALTGAVPVSEAATMREAVERGFEAARPDGVVLLAPACSSFDWYRDYADRGETFMREVERLKENVNRGRER